MQAGGAAPGGFAFPAELTRVELSSRLRSRPGFGFGAVGAGALLIAAAYFIYWVLGGFTDLEPLKFVGGGLLLGAAGIAVQLLRLLKPVTLALGPDKRIGVYEGNRLAKTALLGEVVEYRLSLYNTLREFMAYGMLGIGGLIGAIFYLLNASDANIGYLIPIAWTIAAGFACIGLLGNSIWTRAMARHYFVRGSGKSYKIVLQKSDLKRVGWAR